MNVVQLSSLYFVASTPQPSTGPATARNEAPTGDLFPSADPPDLP